MTFAPQKHVIVPVDFSEQSLDAVRVAQTIAERPESVEVVHVLPMMSPMDPGVVWDAWNDQSRKTHATQALKSRLAERGIFETRVTVLIGDPAREVTHLAETEKADLIVIPSHGRTGAARILIGSVAERVVRHAHCPVLVLRH